MTGGRLGLGSLDGVPEGRSVRETEMHAFYARAHPQLGAVPFADSWYGTHRSHVQRAATVRRTAGST